MRFSEAIRLGAMMKPQHFWHLRNEDKTATCAVGAALEGANIGTTFYVGAGGRSLRGVMVVPGQLVYNIPQDWTDLFKMASQCPVCPNCKDSLRNIAAHLNDDHRWTREQIADWAELQEPIDPPAELPEEEPQEVAEGKPCETSV